MPCLYNSDSILRLAHNLSNDQQQTMWKFTFQYLEMQIPLNSKQALVLSNMFQRKIPFYGASNNSKVAKNIL